MVGNVVEEAGFVEIGARCEGVDIPPARFTSYLDAIETLTDGWPFANRDQPARSIVQLLPAGAQHNPVFLPRVADLDVRSFKIEPFFVDWPWPALTIRLEAAFELHKHADLFAQMPVRVQHVALQ
jgi:hypothetical protein